MNRRMLLGVMAGCLLAGASFAQTSYPHQANGRQVEDLIVKVQSMPTSSLDKRLPAVSLQQWLQALAGKGGRISWVFRPGTTVKKVHDPDCIEVDGASQTGRTFVVLIDVGTDVDHPRVFRAAVIITNKGYAAGVNRLSDLPDALRKSYPDISSLEVQR